MKTKEQERIKKVWQRAQKNPALAHIDVLLIKQVICLLRDRFYGDDLIKEMIAIGLDEGLFDKNINRGGDKFLIFEL